MKALIQRVKSAKVEVAGEVVGSIDEGVLLFLGVGQGDDENDLDWLLNKVLQMRIFPDENGKFDRSLLNVEGELLVVSQFTLMASTKKGNRPSFIGAAHPAKAEELYEGFISKARANSLNVASGKFGANMDVSLVNWGPVTIMMDSKNKQ